MSPSPRRRTTATSRPVYGALTPAGQPLVVRTADGSSDVPDLLDALALATGERRALLRAIETAKKSANTSDLARLRRELRNARDRSSDARTKLVLLLGAPAVAEFEGALATDPRSLEMLPQATGKARRRLVRGAVDAASYIRWHGVASPAACASVFGAFDRIALGRAYLDEAKRDLDSESKAKTGSDLISAGERALARVLEVEATTSRRGPTVIEQLRGLGTGDTTARGASTGTQARPSAPPVATTSPGSKVCHEANAGYARADATRIEGGHLEETRARVGMPEQGARGATPGGGTNRSSGSVFHTEPRGRESHTGSAVEPDTHGFYVAAVDDHEVEEERVRVADRPRVSAEERPRARVTTAPAMPWTPRWCERRKDFLQYDCACCHAKKK